MVRPATTSLLIVLLALGGCTDPMFIDGDAASDASPSDASDGGTPDSTTDSGVRDAGPRCLVPPCFRTGVAHRPIRLHRSPTTTGVASSHLTPELSDDGTTLYYTRVNDDLSSGELMVATRDYTGEMYEEFGDVQPLISGLPIMRATVSGRGLLAVLIVRGREGFELHQTSRNTPSEPFDAPTRIPELSGEQARSLTMTGDGLELVFETGGELWLTSRPTPDDAFVGPSRIVMGGATEPRISRDGLVLTFKRGTVHVEVTRSSREEAFTGEQPSRFTDILDGGDFAPFHHRGAREIWYTLDWPEPSAPNHTPFIGASLMRVRSCPFSGCPAESYITCADDEVGTDDGLHCFSRQSAPAGVVAPEVHRRCEDGTGRLAASIHDPQEVAAVVELFSPPPGRPYLGLVRGTDWRWLTGEPYLGGNWRASEPDPDDTYATIDISDEGWVSEDGTLNVAGICERYVYPRWPADSPVTTVP